MTIAAEPQDKDVIKLSARDWSWILDLLENPPQPNKKMIAAIKSYQALKYDNSELTSQWITK